jgi:hypothetical protein
MLDETLWFHPASGSLIATDVLQYWQGPLSLPVRMYLGLTGGYERLTVPRTVRLLVRDRAAAQLGEAGRKLARTARDPAAQQRDRRSASETAARGAVDLGLSAL